ncbi:MAG: NAD(P)-binding domain-containing protein [Candidatus Parvarchaeota archaeon]|jgi:D-lactate dehydrogenase|nr:NAD(P)-binding domain-containing protein [Candidatus Parvarchaeota archaeon]MCL5106707.1 NAD(P)-binding domain-containing protein [Candidatus Parvarchaeota archaeon]
MKIIFTDVSDFEYPVISKFAEENKDLAVVVYKEGVDRLQEKDFDAEMLSVFINSKVSSEVISRFTKLRFIFTRSTGFDHIDLQACREKRITVCNVPDYGSQTVAEFTFFLMLSLFRKINFSNNSGVKFSRGRELYGKTIGIIGAGKIGNNVGRMAKSFQMNTIYYNRSRSEYLENLDAKKVELEDLLKNSDVVTVHVPLNDGTFHLINKDNIKLMKKDAFLINTARGAILETDAVIDALDSKRIGGVALDVIEGEEFSGREMEIIRKKENYDVLKNVLERSILRNFENAILTPHIAYDTEEALSRIVFSTFDNVLKAHKGLEVSNIVE